MKLTPAERMLILSQRSEKLKPAVGMRLQKVNSGRKFAYRIITIYQGNILLATENSLKKPVSGDKIMAEVVTQGDWMNGDVWKEWELL